MVITYFSGIVDEHDHIRLGGYPGAFRELLGVRTTEFLPLLEGQRVQVEGLGGTTVAADTWAEDLELAGAEAVATYVDGPAAGLPGRHPAAGRAPARRGTSPPGSTPTAPTGSSSGCVAETGVERLPGAAPLVEVTRRVGDDASWLFVINHGERRRPGARARHRAGQRPRGRRRPAGAGRRRRRRPRAPTAQDA